MEHYKIEFCKMAHYRIESFNNRTCNSILNNDRAVSLLFTINISKSKNFLH